MRIHPWHEIPLGPSVPDVLNLVVEVPGNTSTKYELNLDLGILRIDRIMHPAIPYPSNYGFLPQTLDEDGDPLDAMVLMRNTVAPLTVLSARPVGVAHLADRGKNDDKIICVHIDDPKYDDYESIDDLPAYEQQELEWFFEEYKDVMQRDVEVKGLFGPERARESIQMSRENYQEKFPNGWQE